MPSPNKRRRAGEKDTGQRRLHTPRPTLGSGGRTQRISDFCHRVRFLLDKKFDGNVTAAARKMGVSQRGLAKVYAGETTEPRLTLIQALFRAFPEEDRDFIILGTDSVLDQKIHAAAREEAKVLAKRAIDQLDQDENTSAATFRAHDGNTTTHPRRRAGNGR